MIRPSLGSLSSSRRLLRSVISVNPLPIYVLFRPYVSPPGNRWRSTMTQASHRPFPGRHHPWCAGDLLLPGRPVGSGPERPSGVGHHTSQMGGKATSAVSSGVVAEMMVEEEAGHILARR